MISATGSRATGRAEPTDAARDRRTAGERAPDGRGNTGDPGRPEKAGEGEIGLHAGADHGDAGDGQPVSDA